MKLGVKWVYQQVKHHGVPMEAGQKPGLCLQGHKHMLCVVAAAPVRVLVRPAADFERYRQVMDDSAAHKHYEVEKAAKKLQEIGRRTGITERAKQLLHRALHQETHDVDETAFEDEEDLTFSTTAAGAAQEETTMAKAKKTTSKSKSKSKQPTTKAAGSKTPAAKSAKNPLGREGSVARFFNDAIIAGGQEDVAIVAAARKQFPDRKIGDAYASWYRAQLKKHGLLK